jgi:hypothetical protein
MDRPEKNPPRSGAVSIGEGKRIKAALARTLSARAWHRPNNRTEIVAAQKLLPRLFPGLEQCQQGHDHNPGRLNAKQRRFHRTND